MYRCAKQCVPLMRLSPCLVSPVLPTPTPAPAPAPTSEPSHDRSCSIINISSTRALMSEPDTEAYAASKGAIVALTHALAASLGKFKIRVNCISPGWIEVSITMIMPLVCIHYWSIHPCPSCRSPTGRRTARRTPPSSRGRTMPSTWWGG
eukprot:TRINITY_DN9207_c0_g1_i3.p2 TRINITY_DN9207_c0_g1~~TRINITY_DN9207_c0_g1_i3.p2  ORF type:complete len:150 (-),score=18.84 TRINITY_DN9207_c0_g1_i3:219-668(-)